MRALSLGLALAAALLAAVPAAGQSLSPMQHAGVTPSGTKGFKLLVGNPYPTRMTFRVVPMDTAFETPSRARSPS